MGRISVELIPRNADALQEEGHSVHAHFPQIDTINIPDLLQFNLRSYTACAHIASLYRSTIPHIRAIDLSPNAPLPGADQPELKEILVVRGDPPKTLHHQTYPNTSESIIRRYKAELPHLKIYAAFDPYRRSPQMELEAVLRKKEAGVDGFFTQPFFDVNFLEVCMDWLKNEHVFWGICPVIGSRSRSYWESTNKVVFPSTFKADMESNITLGQRLLKTIQHAHSNAYIMPLRVDIRPYLDRLINENMQ